MSEKATYVQPRVVQPQVVQAIQEQNAPMATVVSTDPNVGPPIASQATMVVDAVSLNAQPMMVTCPMNAIAGQPIQVINPSTGQAMQVVVPAGIGPGQQFQVIFPAQPPIVPVVAAQQVFVHSTQPAANMRSCRGCGRTFELEPGQNPASASAYRCKNCRGFRSITFF